MEIENVETARSVVAPTETRNIVIAPQMLRRQRTDTRKIEKSKGSRFVELHELDAFMFIHRPGETIRLTLGRLHGNLNSRFADEKIDPSLTVFRQRMRYPVFRDDIIPVDPGKVEPDQGQKVTLVPGMAFIRSAEFRIETFVEKIIKLTLKILNTLSHNTLSLIDLEIRAIVTLLS
jgi:hypothetical protein